MFKWIALLVVALLALWIWVGARKRRLARRRLSEFLSRRGVAIAEIRAAGAYGWPMYELEFHSKAERERFQQSPDFTALLAEIQSIHNDFMIRGERFNANTAVLLRPL